MSSSTQQQASDGQTRLAYILGVPIAEQCLRQWPQMREAVRSRQLISAVEQTFDGVTLEVGRRLRGSDFVVVEWSINYGDDRIYRNVTIGELANGEAIKVTDYWGEPTETPGWRKEMTDQLEMPADGIWPSKERLGTY